ncbi:hypothetical protein N7533_012507 [Penicillium manginii]|uniref:uncharacterized protein n=1 Tax=Penicillium manginii TaxID=203109 RepID=UPI002546F428|nr:uncharacterized protein N7533_012507 [Penicillium manginii]KAJ5739723.1 hypothetical protein N7533_012507 [Penicillium manginii]
MSGFISKLEKATRWLPEGISTEERSLVHKLDLLILPYACLSFFVKYLDVSALTNAYVSGMKEDLDLYGNRLNYINAAYEVGYVIFQIPSNLVLIKYPAQYYLPAAELFWGMFTLGTAFVKSYEQLVVMRFFVGLSATSCYVGLVHVVNSWLFIICTVITIPVAILGFFIFPDMPDRTKSRYLNEEEKALARKRLVDEGFRPSTGLKKDLFKRVLASWRFYAFVSTLVIFCQMTYAEATPFILWLDSQPDKYPIALVNNLSTVTNGAAAAGALIMSFYSDIRGSRLEPIILSGVLCIFTNLVLSIWNIPDGLKFFAYISVGWSYGTIPVLITWTAEGLANDLELRAVSFATYNTIAEICGLVIPLVAWPVSKAPGFRGGFIWATSISFLYLLTVSFTIFKLRHSRKNEDNSELQNGIDSEDVDSEVRISTIGIETTVATAKDAIV